MGSKPTQIKDGVKPENTSGGTGGVPSQSSAPDQPSKTILSVIEQVKLSVEPKLWRLDAMPIGTNTTVEILIGRVYTRDNSRTFPAIVIRLKRDNSVVRDYTLSVAPISYLLEYLEFANEKKLTYLRDFVNAFRIQPRTVNAEVEDGEVL
jgi:hypothetical protein